MGHKNRSCHIWNGARYTHSYSWKSIKTQALSNLAEKKQPNLGVTGRPIAIWPDFDLEPAKST